MALFGGSSSKTKKITNITTTTKTNIRDVGLTGQNAVDMAAILQTGAIESSRISAASMNNLMQTVGKSSQQLIGGASDLIRTQGDIAQGGSSLTNITPYIAIAAIAAVFLVSKSR